MVKIAVAPLAGAWIEMVMIMIIYLMSVSLPSRERGLKYALKYTLVNIYKVAPLAGAWIEIAKSLFIVHNVKSSLPSRERGLKLAVQLSSDVYAMSLPSRERGLKFALYVFRAVCRCRSPRGSVD